MTYSNSEGTPRVVKAWARIQARAWLDQDFKTRLLSQPAEVLEGEGIAIPRDFDIQVEEVHVDPNSEPIAPVKLRVPFGVPLTIPAGLQVQVEAIQSQDNILSVEVLGVQVEEQPNTQRLTLVLLLSDTPPPALDPTNEDSKQKLIQFAAGLDEPSSDDSALGCIPLPIPIL